MSKKKNEIYLKYSVQIIIPKIPVQWIPKIELFYPDLPQFPIMYIHTVVRGNRLVACPVSVSYTYNSNVCDAVFYVLTNLKPNKTIIQKIKSEIEERIGYSNQISKQDVIDCCRKNRKYIKMLTDLWSYVEKSYGLAIPFGRFYEEIYSIPRFVAAWQPKTGRQSEMRMLYNFMSMFGEEVIFPSNWNHLEFYIIPTYTDVLNRDYSIFPKFYRLYSAMKKIFKLDFHNTITIEGVKFNVMSKAWKQNKNDFIKNVTSKYLKLKKINQTDKQYLEKLVDAFNRHSWRAAYFISSFINIELNDYKNWDKKFFNSFYNSAKKLKGYSEKVIACFLQQGFGKEEIIPIDTWIKTFYQYPLGISDRDYFFNSFNMLGKLERVIWLSSQANKTNMKNFFNVLWCQRYGTIGNGKLRGINPIACSLCKLNKTCVGLQNKLNDLVLLSNESENKVFKKTPKRILNNISCICLLENGVPKKVLSKDKKWSLVDEFSGYLMTERDKLPKKIINKKIVTVNDFVNNYR